MTQIPRVTFRVFWRVPLFLLAVTLVVFTEAVRRAIIPEHGTMQIAVIAVWILIFGYNLAIYALAWLERPYTVTPRQQGVLDSLWVTVVIPVFNEDPAALDLCIRAVMEQERLPQEVVVIDDGSTVAYPGVRTYWGQMRPYGVRFHWLRQPNSGKRHAQAIAFRNSTYAHIFVTLDSDTVLERRAIGEGLKPFADRRVTSVAGIEMGLNMKRNWLTRIAACRQLIWQVTVCAAQSVRGQVLVNRGTFALYRGDVVRRYLTAYESETFFGRPVSMSDDSYLTLFSLLEGRTVQQPTAVQFTLFPENLSHHMRQWMRWMRGSTVRSIWRIRYLPVASLGWLFTVASVWSLFVSTTMVIVSLAYWHAGLHVIPLMLWSAATFAYAGSMRIFQYRRSDDSMADLLDTFCASILAVAWSMTFLKILRLYGIFTCKKAAAGWGTRQQKAEVAV